MVPSSAAVSVPLRILLAAWLCLSGLSYGRVVPTAKPPEGALVLCQPLAVRGLPPSRRAWASEAECFLHGRLDDRVVCHNDPVNHVDVLGLATVAVGGSGTIDYHGRILPSYLIDFLAGIVATHEPLRGPLAETPAMALGLNAADFRDVEGIELPDDQPYSSAELIQETVKLRFMDAVAGNRFPTPEEWVTLYREAATAAAKTGNIDLRDKYWVAARKAYLGGRRVVYTEAGLNVAASILAIAIPNPLSEEAAFASWFGRGARLGARSGYQLAGRSLTWTENTGTGLVYDVNLAANTARGLSRHGGVFSETITEGGASLWTSTGRISQNDFASLVNGGLYKGTGEVDILSGVHGLPDGRIVVDRSLFEADFNAFLDVPGVTVHNLPDLTPNQIIDLIRNPNTTIGGFCDSDIYLSPFK